jgi:hypothetical protein
MSPRHPSKAGDKGATGKNLVRVMILLGSASLMINLRYFANSHFSGMPEGNQEGAQPLWDMVQEVLQKPLRGHKVRKTFDGEYKGGQLVKKDKRGRTIVKQITALSKKDLGDFGGDDNVGEGALTLEEAMKGREPIIQSLREAGIQDFDAATVSKLPLWSQVEKLYGKGPVVHGLETCDIFKKSIPPQDWSLASAGIFNSGTNTLAMYMNANCHIPQNKKEKYGGMRWQVPWGQLFQCEFNRCLGK